MASTWATDRGAGRWGPLAWSGVGIESPVHLLFLGAVALMVLGPKRLPSCARARQGNPRVPRVDRRGLRPRWLVPTTAR